MTLTAVRRALILAWLTIAWNFVESAISIAFGASDHSVSLLGFGADSLIEVASGALVLWRFHDETSGRLSRESRERRATLGIGALFILLGFGTAAGAVLAIGRHAPPTTTVPGIVVSLACVSVMAWLWHAKTRVAREIDSATVMKDAACSLACAKLSLVLLIGSLTFAAAPKLWWADSAAAAILALLFVREGWETVEAARREDFSGGCGCADERDG